MLLNTGQAEKGKIDHFVTIYILFSQQNIYRFLLTKIILPNEAIEVLESQVKRRDGAPFLWHLLVHLHASLPSLTDELLC